MQSRLSPIALGYLLTTCLALSTNGTAAIAADAPTSPDQPSSQQLGDIVVTASRRSQNAQNVGISISAISGDRLRDQGASSTTDIANLVPGVQVISPNTGSNNFFSIRGVSQIDFSEHEESPVAVYLDDVYMSQSAGTASLLFDTARVEILRGPQGTLFGRNATGGLVQYISNGPTDKLVGYADLTLGSFAEERFEGAIGGPITDTITSRLSIANNHNSPWLRNVSGAGYDANNGNDWAVRWQTRYRPTDKLTFLLNLHGAKTDIRSGLYKQEASYLDPNNHGLGTPVPADQNIYGTCPECDMFGYRDTNGYRTANSNRLGFNRTSIAGATLKTSYDLGKLNLTAISDYTKFRKNYYEDSDASPNDVLAYGSRVDVNQFSQEARIDNGGTGHFRWVAGAYFLRIDGKYETTLYIPVDSPADAFRNPFILKTTSYAFFGQAEYDVVPSVTFIAGARWSHEQKTMVFISYQLSGAQPNDRPIATAYVFNTRVDGDLARLSKGDWSARLALNWHITPNVMSYVSWNRGIKAGGFNAPLAVVNVTADQFKFQGETLNAYEVGLKSEFFDRLARLNLSGFCYNYSNYQAFNFHGLTQLVFNAPATIYGGEAELTLQPFAGLRLQQGLAYLHARARDVPLPDNSFATRTIPQSPKIMLTGLARYEWQVGQHRLAVQTDYSYRGDLNFALSGGPSTRQKGYILNNARVSFASAADCWRIAAFVDNFLNRHYATAILDVSSLGFSQIVVGRPRWAGIDLHYNF